ncbi:hypothetical protein C1646_766446 [Rhizophagus diaphanus]|nr:hypothetical protein C1646_766446 [Rhizophagus diaphanus] [Rhizophagus sp. MUCL 43196]
MACFKEILYMEENIIIRKIVKEKGFTRDNSNVDELESSEDENEMKREKERAILKDIDNNNKEKAIGIAEKWVEKRHINVTIDRIMRLIKLGFDELKLENDKKLIEKYEEYKDLLDDKLIIKLNEINNEEDNDEITETEEKLRRIKRLIEYLEIEVTEGELLIKKFIEKFQTNKEKLGEEIKRILDEYLRISSDDNKENELSIEKMVQKLLKERDEVLGEVTETEIRKLLEWEYNSNVILKNKIIFQYRKLKIELDPYDENDKEIKEKLNKYILELENKEKMNMIQMNQKRLEKY